MENVIELLARLGRDASLRHASDETLAIMASESGLGEAVGGAVMARDPAVLRDVLGQGIFFATQMGDPLREEEEPADDGDGDDDAGEEKSSSHLASKPEAFGLRH